MERFPYICKEHRDAQIVHEYTQDYITRAGNPIVREEVYKCAVCGKRLAPSLAEASMPIG